MLAIPNTTVSILRGTTVSAFGDPTDSETPVATGIPASLMEQGQRTTRPADRRPQVLRLFKCRLPYTTDVRVGDLIRDDRTGTVYALDDSTLLDGFVVRTDRRLNLRLAT